jgi:hypothetical protein
MTGDVLGTWREGGSDERAGRVLDYLFGTGSHAGRAPGAIRQVMLLDLKPPRIDGLEVPPAGVRG